MKKYLVRFTTRGGDYNKTWCYVNSENDTLQTIKDYYIIWIFCF